MTICTSILEYLKEKGISQSFLARRTGIGMSKLNPALHGKRRLTVEEYQQICAALEVPPQRFLTPEAACGTQAPEQELLTVH